MREWLWPGIRLTNRYLFEANNMLANKPKTKILVDGGDPRKHDE